MEEETNKKTQSFEEKLFDSPAVSSLIQETEIYDGFKKLGWQVNHSPYYIDKESKKLREVDITARKLWVRDINNKELVCEINFIVESKSLKDYNVVVTNRIDYKSGDNLIHIWIGEDSYNRNLKIIEMLKNNKIGSKTINHVIEKLKNWCYPKEMFLFKNYRVDSFDLPVYNSFRETNIGNTKDLDSSVVWKAFQSIYSCVENYNNFLWDQINDIIEIEKKDLLNEQEVLKEILDSLEMHARHLTYIHPVLVIEANLWEINKDRLNKIKFFRLIFDKMFEQEMWIDVVNINYLKEYLKKTNEYDKFLKRKKFIRYKL